MTRRTFIETVSVAAVMPPLARGAAITKLESPRGAEQTLSYRKITVQATLPVAQETPRAFMPTDFVLSITRNQSNTIQLTWVNGNAPFMVQTRPSVNATWVNLGNAQLGRSKTVTITQPMALFRVQSAYRLAYGNAAQPRITRNVPNLT